MAITKVNLEIATLLEKIGEAREGAFSIKDPQNLYIEDVKKRVPIIERALSELKQYLDSLDA
jgi:hypothetical protein